MSRKTDFVRYVVDDGLSIAKAAEKTGYSYSYGRLIIRGLVKDGIIKRAEKPFIKGKGYEQYIRRNE